MQKRLSIVLLLTLLTMLVGKSAASDTPPKLSELKAGAWNMMSPGGDTICARGTPYHFFVHPAAKPSDKLAIYFQGGGACWNGVNCANGFRFPPDSKSPLFKEAVAENEDQSYVAGIFDFANPENPFADYNTVYVSYCTADIHTGDSVADFKDKDGKAYQINFKGAVNAKAALDWTYANFEKPSEIFLSGSSAGAYGSIYHAANIMNHYKDTKVVQFGDAGLGVTTKDFDGFSVWGTLKNRPEFVPGLAQAEGSKFTNNLMYSETAKAFPNNMFSQYTTWTDNVQIGFFLLMGGGKDGQEAGGNWVVGMRSRLTGLQGSLPNFRGYTAWGGTHTILGTPDFYTYEVNGVRIRDWVADLVAGKPVRNVSCSDCTTPELFKKAS